MTEKINVYYVIENNKVVWGTEDTSICLGHCVRNFIIDGEERDPNIRKKYSSYEAEAFNYSKDWNVGSFFIEFFITEGLTSIGEKYYDTHEFIQLSKDGIFINNIGELALYHGNNTIIKEIYNLYKNEGLNDCVRNQYKGYRWGARIDLNNRTFEIFKVWSALNKDDSKITGSFNEDGHITDYKW